MDRRVCPQCGAPVEPDIEICKFCGTKLELPKPAQPEVQAPPVRQAYAVPVPDQQYVQPVQPPMVQQGYGQSYNQGYNQSHSQQQYPSNSYIDPSWPVRNKLVAVLLAFLLGGLGIHKFYMNQIGMGVLYLLFFWTGIPALLGFIDGIMYLSADDEKFQMKYHVRLG